MTPAPARSCYLLPPAGPYESLRAALSNLRPPASLAPAFLSLASSHPLLTMHYSHLALLTGSRSWVGGGTSLWVWPQMKPLPFQVLSVLKESSISHSPSHLLLHRCLLPLVTSPADSVLAAALAQHTHRYRDTEYMYVYIYIYIHCTYMYVFWYP